MPFTREQKTARVKELADQLRDKTTLILSDFTGMDVATATDMRRELRDASVECRVVKNSLAIRAIEDAGLGELAEFMTGPNAIVMTDGDPAPAAKILVDYEKRKKTPQIRTGLVDAVLVTAEDIRKIAELPSREVLLAQIAAGFQAPVAGLARLLHELTRTLVATLDAVAKQKGAESGA